MYQILDPTMDLVAYSEARRTILWGKFAPAFFVYEELLTQMVHPVVFGYRTFVMIVAWRMVFSIIPVIIFLVEPGVVENLMKQLIWILCLSPGIGAIMMPLRR